MSHNIGGGPKTTMNSSYAYTTFFQQKNSGRGGGGNKTTVSAKTKAQDVAKTVPGPYFFLGSCAEEEGFTLALDVIIRAVNDTMGGYMSIHRLREHLK